MTGVMMAVTPNYLLCNDRDMNVWTFNTKAMGEIMQPSRLTHLSRMEFPTLINWTISFPFKGLLDCIFFFYSVLNRTFYKLTVETLIRRRV